MFQVLVQEVGEGSTVQSLLAASSGWRGRAQQIITLQKKVCRPYYFRFLIDLVYDEFLL